MDSTGFGRFLRRQAHYRKIFVAANGEGPWPCCFCGNPVTNEQGRGGRYLAIHHLDGNYTNDVAENLVASHWDCHSRWHSTGRIYTAETRAKMSASVKRRFAEIGYPMQGKTHSAETRAKISAANKGQIPWTLGRTHSAETRAKISAGNRGKVMSPEARAKLRAANLGKKRGPMSPEARAKISAGNKGKKVGRPLSAEHRAKIGAAGKGRKVSPETRAKISAAHTGKSRPPERTCACQHCGREVRGSLLARHERACTRRS